MEWCTRWFGSPYYTLLYGHRDAADAHNWVTAMLGRWHLPQQAQVLDLACGRGRHAHWYAKAGLRVTGVDIDPVSIAAASAHVPEGDFLVHDMRHPLPLAGFDAASCLFTSLGYSSDPADDQRTLANVQRCLAPGGRFVLDFMNAPVVSRMLVREETRTVGGVRFRVTRAIENEVLVKHIVVEDGARCMEFEERVRAWHPRELEHMIIAAGFIIEDRTEGPNFAPFVPQRSERFVLWCRKRLQ